MTINAVAYDYQNVRISVAGRELEGVVSISYNASLETEKISGSGREDIDETEGHLTIEDGELELHQYEYRNLIEALGDGFLTKKARFDITVTYAHAGEPVIVDALERCRLKGFGHELSKGDVPMVTVPFSCMRIRVGGGSGNQLDPMAG
jgi:hypothetical protein